MYKIMVVDDEPLMREYMKTNIPLINESWQVAAEAMDGCEALEVLEKQQFDLIITDIKMPLMDGLEFCRLVSEKYPEQKIIILSGYDEFAFAREAIRYGVYEYLLKPVVREELQSILGKITGRIENEKNEQLAYRTMMTLSEDSKKQAVKNFLRAAISDSSIEIKSLYPLIFRLKVILIESEGVIMILHLDEEVILEKSIPLSDIPIFRFILNQIATEVLEDDKTGWVFFDMEENTNILLTGDDVPGLIQKCIKTYSIISSTMYEYTRITVTGAVGTPVDDVLQLNISYNKASTMLLSRLIYGGNSVFTSQDNNISKFVLSLDKVLSAIKSGLLDNNEMSYSVSVKSYVELIDKLAISTILRFGIYMIKCIEKLKLNLSAELTVIALNMLKTLVDAQKDMPEMDDVIKVFKDIVKLFANDSLQKENTINEHDVILKAREYIYTHYSEPVSLALIAEKIGISSSYLSSIFHKDVGESYIKFLTRIRMEQAARLLKSSPPVKVYDVSEKVGYVSVKHFSYIFKQYFGMTPGEYQNK